VLPPLDEPALPPPVPPVVAPALLAPAEVPEAELPLGGMIGSPESSDELLHATREVPTNKPAAAATRPAALFTWIFTSNFL
jgi:hypothetical protein